jgi:hypothetical protein
MSNFKIKKLEIELEGKIITPSDDAAILIILTEFQKSSVVCYQDSGAKGDKFKEIMQEFFGQMLLIGDIVKIMIKYKMNFAQAAAEVMGKGLKKTSSKYYDKKE